MTSTFAHDLDELIAKHLGKVARSEEFEPLLDALDAAFWRLAKQADSYRFSNESAEEYRRRREVLVDTLFG
jgi:hypothetical protein